MGISNKIIIPYQKKIIKKFTIKDKDKIKRIAFLGSVKSAIDDPKSVESYVNNEFNLSTLDTFDVLDLNFDLNKEWNISGYDLIICFRSTMYINSKNHFFSQIKKLIQANERVLFDFTIYSGNLLDKENKDTNFSKKYNRMPPYGSESISYDFRELLGLLLKLKVIIYYGLGYKYFEKNLVNSFKYQDLVDNFTEPQKTSFFFNKIKKDLICFLYWVK